MKKPHKLSLLVQPAITREGRYGVYILESGEKGALYQATMGTFPNSSAAKQVAINLKPTFERRGISVDIQLTENQIQRTAFESIDEADKELKELKQHLSEYVNSTLSILTKIEKKALLRCPFIMSLLILVAIFLPDSVGKFVIESLPKYLGIAVDKMPLWTPAVIFGLTLWQYFLQHKVSTEEDRVRRWMLKLTIDHGWRRQKFVKLLSKEFEKREYAYAVHLIKSLSKHDPAPLSETIRLCYRSLFEELDDKSQNQLADDTTLQREIVQRIADEVLAEDFERKLHALYSLDLERAYSPTDLALQPLFLINSQKSVQLRYELLNRNLHASGWSGTDIINFKEAMTCIGFFLGSLIHLVPIIACLSWACIRTLDVSKLMFITNVTISFLALAIPALRMWTFVSKKRGYPKGLGFSEGLGAMFLF